MKKKLKFEKVSSRLILKILKEFKTNKATGVDNLATRFLKEGSDILCTPVAKICNLFYQTQHPVYIALPLISKIKERIIHDQTMNFLSDNSVLYKYQPGFYKNINKVLKNFTQQDLVRHTSITKSQKFSILVS